MSPNSIYSVLFSILVIFLGCEITNSSSEEAEVVLQGDTIFIKDRTGKEWNVTHAVREYGFVAAQFQYGLGPYAIKPILDPQMLNPGDPGYPAPRNDQVVIGTTMSKIPRAYPLSVLGRHEIVDETFGEQHVAVAY
jgi:hypothetical protein